MKQYDLCSNISELVAVMKKLRAPDGCPWDRKDPSLPDGVSYGESGELLDAIAADDDANMRRSLADSDASGVHSVMAEEAENSRSMMSSGILRQR